MKAITLVLVAIGFVANPVAALSLNVRAKPTGANAIISHEHHDKIKNRTSLWKPYKPEENPLFHLSDD